MRKPRLWKGRPSSDSAWPGQLCPKPCQQQSLSKCTRHTPPAEVREAGRLYGNTESFYTVSHRQLTLVQNQKVCVRGRMVMEQKAQDWETLDLTRPGNPCKTGCTCTPHRAAPRTQWECVWERKPPSLGPISSLLMHECSWPLGLQRPGLISAAEVSPGSQQSRAPPDKRSPFSP